MARWLAVVCLAIGVLVGGAWAQGRRYEVAGFDDADAFEDFFDAFQAAVGEGDKLGVADLVSFPITVNRGRKKQEVIATPREFAKAWRTVFTAKVKKAVAKQEIADLFVNSKGVMVGNGEVWFISVEGQDKPSLSINPE